MVEGRRATYPGALDGSDVVVELTYNSQELAPYGLTGSYYLDPGAPRSFAGLSPVMVRRDPTVGFRWGTAAPAPAVPNQGFMVRWDGWLTPPGTDTYRFYTARAGGSRMWVAGQLIQDHWDDASVEPDFATPIALTGGTRVPIRIEHYQAGAQATMGLAVMIGSSPQTYAVRRRPAGLLSPPRSSRSPSLSSAPRSRRLPPVAGNAVAAHEHAAAAVVAASEDVSAGEGRAEEDRDGGEGVTASRRPHGALLPDASLLPSLQPPGTGRITRVPPR